MDLHYSLSLHRESQPFQCRVPGRETCHEGRIEKVKNLNAPGQTRENFRGFVLIMNQRPRKTRSRAPPLTPGVAGGEIVSVAVSRTSLPGPFSFFFKEIPELRNRPEILPSHCKKVKDTNGSPKTSERPTSSTSDKVSLPP